MFASFDSRSTTDQTDEVLFQLSLWHLERCEAHPDSPQVRRLVEARDTRALCLYDAQLGPTAEAEYHLSQVLAYFSKRADLDIGVDKQAVAWEAFVAAETRCQQTNYIFRKYAQGEFQFPPDVEHVLYVAQRKIARILGDVPRLEDLKPRFGPGATTQVKKKDASARRKLAQMFACSDSTEALLPHLLSETPLWSQLPEDGEGLLHYVIHNDKVEFARKNAKTDRTITKTACVTGMWQLAVGDLMSRLLKASGIDIFDQSQNQRLARLGSITGEIATLDLKSASDLKASGLVESLLPYDWWCLLSRLRSTTVDTPSGVPLSLSKFCTMGNGFTFPLETLIFYALSKAAQEVSGFQGPVSVYGDDIIVPTGAVPLVIRVLHACGFLVNTAKSFVEGPFRESCGKDYFSGIDVRPVFMKDVLTGADVFRLYNFYQRKYGEFYDWSGVKSFLLSLLDSSLVLWGPDGFGDGHLVRDDASDLRPHGRERGFTGYTFETYTWMSKKALYRLGADGVFPAYSIYLRAHKAPEESFPMLKTRRFLRRKYRQHWDAWPLDESKASYSGGFLEDTLTGVQGYKRHRIYIIR